jgi:hypothetical protein
MALRKHRSSGYGLDLSNLPASRLEAVRIGAAYFFTGKACRHGHLAARYTKGGSCTWCARSKSAAHYGKTFSGSMPKALANAARSGAVKVGALTYVPPSPCPEGHQLRWTASSNCVECDRIGRAKYADARKDARILKLYRLTPADHEALFRDQDEACAICEEPQQDRRAMHVDHCHQSDRVRGLLCSRCNQALGLFKDNPSVMLRAAEYVHADTPGLPARG